MKVLIIGLDGGTWDVMDDYVLENHMPNLNRLKSEGYSGILKSTNPWITPPAWTTCLTGCNPAKHGISGFQRYSFADEKLEVMSRRNCMVPNMWQELSRQGYKVASINVPWTYPCEEINGIMVAGYGCPGVHTDFTYPPEFKRTLLEKIPDYDIQADRGWKPSGNSESFDERIALVERSFEQKLEAARLVGQETDWDVLMVEFQDIDALQHKVWSYLNKRSRDRHAPERDRLFRALAQLDRVVGELLDLASSEGLTVVVVSDHGFGNARGHIMPNTLLHRWGYLKFKSLLSRKISKKIRRLRQKISSLLLSAKIPSEHFDPERLGAVVDLRHSKAVVMHIATNGYLYVNLEGRQPSGIVAPGAEYTNLINELRRRFESAVHPDTGERLFTRVATPAEFYGVSEISAERFGDLILSTRPEYKISLRVDKRDYLRKMSRDTSEGFHHPNGIFSFSGPNIKPRKDIVTDIVNIAPMVYAALGAKLPTYMDGVVIAEAFSRPPEVQFQQEQERITIASTNDKLSKKDQEKIEERLSHLGYLD